MNVIISMRAVTALIFFLFFCLSVAYSQVSYSDNPEVKKMIAKTFEHFDKGEYRITIEALSELEIFISEENLQSDKLLGLISYWRAITLKRLNEFPQALDQFRLAIKFKHNAKDLYYEYAQTLYTSELMEQAIAAFQTSARQKYKEAVSWYYVGFIQQNNKNYKKAIDAYKNIEESNDPEKKDVYQASQMQLGDIYYELAKNKRNAVQAMEKIVIPQFKKAYDYDPESRIANDIYRKIVETQRIFELVLFKLRNGRPTVQPPYFLRLSAGVTQDSNVIFASDESANITQTAASLVYNTTAMGRYTYYYKNFLSFSPEVRFAYTKHAEQDVSEIAAADNYGYNIALRNSYEYTKDKKPAGILFDYEYGYIARNIASDGNLTFNSKSHNIMLGQRLNIFDRGESIFRYKYRNTINVTASSNATTHSFTYEQMVGFENGHTVLLYNSLDLLRSETSTNDNNALTLRADYILPRIGELGTPSFGLGVTLTDTMAQSSSRGMETTISPSLKLTKSFGRKYRWNLKYDMIKNNSKSTDYTFTKSIYGFDVEYVY
jgi:tetratricopeptide (TPR) repeat protein